MSAEVEALKKRVAELEDIIKQRDEKPSSTSYRGKIETMSSEVVDSNPYSRLMALKRMGIVDNYEKIRELSVIIVGLGGIGSVAAEMLTRCGIGKLVLFDYDKVELANMNRLFFKPDQAGMTKTAASKQTLTEINPDVEIEDYTYDITVPENFDHFCRMIESGGKDGGRISLVLSCVDNFVARTAINQACNELDQVWMESGVSEDAVSGHIQTLLPGRTACFECLPPLIVASGIDEKTLKREGVCAASLPTTMGLVAALLVQNTLKYLLQFGQTCYYLGYSALMDHFPGGVMRPNPECGNRHCCALQLQYRDKWAPMEWSGKAVDETVETHSENAWGIEVVGVAEPGAKTNVPPLPPHTASSSANSNSNSNPSLPTGIEFRYEMRESAQGEGVGEQGTEDLVSLDSGLSLDDLMKQLKSIT
eukprot:gene3504-6972_t